MPKFTAFLGLTLPELNEFVNSWNQPVNQNSEKIDDYLDDVQKALVGTGSSSVWSDLRGSLASLAARLDVSLNPDGTINVANSPGVMAIATSATRGVYPDPQSRLDASDFKVFDARQPVAGGRFAPIPVAGPSAGVPPEDLDSGVAIRSADYGLVNGPISSPRVPWSPGLVVGGSNPLITGLGVGQVRITGDVPPAVFNIDGYVFRIREIIDFDWTGLAPANGSYVWLFVDRTEGTYNNANFKYSAPGGGAFAVKDLRRLQSGIGSGTTSGSVFTATGAHFATAAFGKVAAGDTLVITSGAAAGSYVISALDGGTPDTKLTIRGSFRGAVTGVSWYVLDTSHPNIGAVVTDSSVWTLPPTVAGRVYFARATHNSGGAPTNIVTFQRGGVYDSGWVAVDGTTLGATIWTHNLGVVPVSVEVLCRKTMTGNVSKPLIRRTIATVENSGNETLVLPSLDFETDTVGMVFTPTNSIGGIHHIFWDATLAANESTGFMRVIARR